jgi:hypothetical protein
MVSYAFSSTRIFIGLAVIAVLVFIYLNMNPTIAVVPVPANNPAAAFGTTFDLTNNSIAALDELNFSYCVNSFHNPDGSSPAQPATLNFGTPSPSVSLSNLPRGNTTVLPLESALSGDPSSQVDLVLVIKFTPHWWMSQQERRYRFQGIEAQDKSWSWKEAALGSPCG